MNIRNLVIASTLLIGLLAASSGFAQEERREARNFNTKSLGEIHNEGVKYVLEHIKVAPRREEVGPLVVRLTNEFCVSSHLKCPGLNPELLPPDTEKLLANLNGSAEFNEDIKSIFRIVDRMRASRKLTKGVMQEYQMALDRLENTSSAKLSGEERTRFLGAISVAEASAIFWAPKEAGGLNGEHFLNIRKLHNFSLEGSGLSVLKGDIIGGELGGLHGAIGASAAVLLYHIFWD